MSITDIIAASGKTREQICSEAGISRSYLSMLEAGVRRVGIKSLPSLAAALSVGPEALRPDWGVHFASPSATGCGSADGSLPDRNNTQDLAIGQDLETRPTRKGTA